MEATNCIYDAFIIYAAEDKSFAERLAYFLQDAGLNLWTDNSRLNTGDNLTAKINEGFSKTDSCIIILSSRLFAKKISKESVVATINEDRPGKIVIPIWHDIPYRDVAEIVPLLKDSNISSSEKHSLDSIIENIMKVVVANEKRAHVNMPSIEYTTINNTKLVTLPLRPYNGWTVAIGQHPVTNKQYGNFLKNVKNDILDDILHNHVSEKININYLKSNFHTPCGKLMEDGKEHEPFFPLEDDRFNKPDNPVVCISLIEALGYVSWLNSVLNFNGFIFTLISPELWRYAAFGTNDNKSYTIEDSTQTSMVHKAPFPVPVSRTDERINALGLSDMFGNVWEWCEPEITNRDEGNETGNVSDEPIKTKAEIAGGGYPYDLDFIAPFLSSELLDEGILTRRSDIGFRIAALVNVKNLPPKEKEELMSSENSATSFVEQYFNRNYKYY